MLDKGTLERLYARYADRSHAERDPVSFLYRYREVADREIAGLIAAFLAYGRLKQIMRSVEDALGRLGPRPAPMILGATSQELQRACGGFVHRLVDADRLHALLRAVRDLVRTHGSIQACFLAHDDPAVADVQPGLVGLARELRQGRAELAHLVADPAKGSACKRWHLYLRWMVRRDAVDPGGWDAVSPARLLVPLDAHMWRVCSRLGLTRRKCCNLAAAREITHHFRRVCAADPVRYDFALMHASVGGDPELRVLLDTAPSGRP